MDRARYPPILPALKSHIQSHPTVSRKRQHKTKIACNLCREKKTACNGARPICKACQTRGSQCVYVSKDESETPVMVLKRENESLKEKSTALEQLVNSLRFSSEEDAQDLFQKLRSTSNPPSILSHYSPSEKTTARGLLPPIFSEKEFELHVRHAVGYPLPDPKHERVLLQSVARPTKRAKFDDNTRSQVPSTASSPVVFEHRTAFQSLGTALESETTSFGQGPKLPDHFEYPKLAGLNISYWTDVNLSSELAAGAICLYLDTNHMVLGVFDAQLFLEDLVSCRPEFCSRLLVSSLLAFALPAYGLKHPEAFEKSYELEAEAQNYWHRGGCPQPSDSITTIAGLALMYQSTACHGFTDLGMGYIEAMVQMAHRLRLFGGQSPLTAKDLESLPKEEQNAIAHTAWGAFNLATMLAHFHLTATIENPPLLPIPESFSEPWPLQLENEKYAPPTFSSFCNLWTIMSETLVVYRHAKSGNDISLPFALTMYGKLLQLVDNISEPMHRVEKRPDHVLVFHIWYHAACLDIFRPFISDRRQDSFRSYSASTKSIQAIFAASLKQLKCLVLEFMYKRDAAPCNLFWHIALIYVANAALRDIDDPEWRFYFFLCIRGYQVLYSVYNFAKGSLEGLLAIAMEKGLINAAEARIYVEELKAHENHRNSIDRITGGYIVDLDLAFTDSNAAKADQLMDKYEQMTLFDEFTNSHDA